MNSGSTPDIGTVATIDIAGLSVRYARSGASGDVPILLTAPFPESIYAFHRVLPRLGSQHPLLAVDLPGFGLSQSRPEVMAPEAMGSFLVTLLQRFGISRAHVLAPDVGALAVLFAAAKQPDLFESLALGSAATRVDLAGSPLKDLIQSPPGALAGIDGAEALKDYFAAAEQITPLAIVADFSKGLSRAALRRCRSVSARIPH